MNQEIADKEDLAYKRGKELAEAAIKALDLIKFIRSWNSYDQNASLIAYQYHVHDAIGFDDELSRPLEDFVRQVKSENCEIDFLLWLAVLVAPTICASFVQSLLIKSQQWACGVIVQHPVAFDAPAPFLDTDAMIQWILASVERPAIVSPAGETILDDDAEDHILRQALRAELSTALQDGWLSQPTERRSGRMSNARRSGTPGSRS